MAVVGTFTGHTNRVRRAVLTTIDEADADGSTLLVSGSTDKTLKAWRLKDQQSLKSLRSPSGAIRCVVSLGGALVATGSEGAAVDVWDVVAGTCIASLSEHAQPVCCLLWLGGSLLVSGSADKRALLWDWRSRQVLQVFSGHTSFVLDVAAAGPGRIVTASNDSTLRVWNLDTSKTLGVLSGHDTAVYTVVQAGDRHIVSGSHDTTVKVWDATSFACVATLCGHTAPVCCVSMLDADRLLSSAEDKTVRVWSLATRECVVCFVLEHNSWFLLPVDGGRVVSTSDDGPIRLLDLRHSAVVPVAEKSTSHRLLFSDIQPLCTPVCAEKNAGAADVTGAQLDEGTYVGSVNSAAHAVTVFPLHECKESDESALLKQVARLREIRHPCLTAVLCGHVRTTDARTLQLLVVSERASELSSLPSPHAMRDICFHSMLGLVCLHAQSPPIFHGSMCPNNIVLAPCGHAQLRHFGLTAAAMTSRTFWSPERLAAGGTPSAKDDVWAAALSLLFLGAGQSTPEHVPSRPRLTELLLTFEALYGGGLANVLDMCLTVQPCVFLLAWLP